MRGPGASTAAASRTRWSPRSTSSRRSASWPAIERAASGVRGRSLLPVVRREAPRSTTRCSPRSRTTPPTSRSARCARSRYKYIRRFDNGHAGPVLPEHRRRPEQGPAARARAGRARPRPRSELYDLVFDPDEADNLVADPRTPACSPSCASGCGAWMRETDDPLLLGPVPAPAGAELNDPAGVSAADSPSHEPAVR